MTSRCSPRCRTPSCCNEPAGQPTDDHGTHIQWPTQAKRRRRCIQMSTQVSALSSPRGAGRWTGEYKGILTSCAASREHRNHHESRPPPPSPVKLPAKPGAAEGNIKYCGVHQLRPALFTKPFLRRKTERIRQQVGSGSHVNSARQLNYHMSSARRQGRKEEEEEEGEEKRGRLNYPRQGVQPKRSQPGIG